MPHYVVAYLALAGEPDGAGEASPSTHRFKSPNNSAEYARFYTAGNNMGRGAALLHLIERRIVGKHLRRIASRKMPVDIVGYRYRVIRFCSIRRRFSVFRDI